VGTCPPLSPQVVTGGFQSLCSSACVVDGSAASGLIALLMILSSVT